MHLTLKDHEVGTHFGTALKNQQTAPFVSWQNAKKIILIMQSHSCLFNQVKDRSAFSLKNIFLAVDAFVLKHLTPTFSNAFSKKNNSE